MKSPPYTALRREVLEDIVINQTEGEAVSEVDQIVAEVGEEQVNLPFRTERVEVLTPHLIKTELQSHTA